MKKLKTLFLTAVVGMVAASCTSDEYVGTHQPTTPTQAPAAINFVGGDLKVTRADATGATAANLLGNQFRVFGTSTLTGGTATTVFDNYVVDYNGNIGSDSTNVRGWTYLGQTSKGANPAFQTVKYWDENADHYDFVAFSGLDDSQRITSDATNTFAVDANNMGNIFISNRVTAKKTASNTGTTPNVVFGDNSDMSIVTLTFRRLSARIRLGIYETVPGYAVKDVRFYYGDNYLTTAGTSTKTVAGLRGKFPVAGDITVTYDENNTALADFNATNGTVANNFQFGELDYTTAASTLVSGGFLKEDGTVGATGDAKFLATSSAIPTYAKKDAVIDGEAVSNSAWQNVLPYASNDLNLVLRIDFTLVSLDGVGTPITVKGASAVVPVEYAKWKPNYAYTYIFKISDKTNGTTGTVTPGPNVPDPDNPNPDPGAEDGPALYPITFDATVSTVEEFEQETITSLTGLGGDAITTYSETSDVTTNDEYRVGEQIKVSSISHGMWSLAYSANEVTNQLLNNENAYATIAGAPAAGQTIDQAGVTSAQFTPTNAGYYVVRLRYLPAGREDLENNYANSYKIVKVVD